jgi:cell wall-associated NlpC family hydrolase
VKEVIHQPLPTLEPGGPIEYEEEVVYYEAWEQEYGDLAGGPPYPTPTPYAIVGTSYVFGQRVRVDPLYVTVWATPAQELPDRGQLYLVAITWHNPTDRPIPIAYGAQVQLRSVTQAGGRVVSGDGWHMSNGALAAAGLTAPAEAIPPGESRATVPIIAPAGLPQTVDVTFLRGAALAAEPAATPTPNAELRGDTNTRLVVQWSNSTLGVGPPCDDPGAMTPWEDAKGVSWGHAAQPVPAPPGSSRVVQLTLNQVGKRYVWGAEGPETFDCSGLTQWSYSQIGLRIPRTAQTQRDGLKPIAAAELQPGDLVFFSPRGSAKITHVAMFIGDQDGDGKVDIVHAMSPQLGVRVTYNFLGSAYYSGAACQLCIAGYGSVR